MSWTKCDNGNYATEASSLPDEHKLDCPACREVFSRNRLIHTERRDGEILYWKFKCPHCQTILTVFND